MPNIKGISTNDKGDITITPSKGTAQVMTKASISLATENIDTGAKDVSKTGYDTYYHSYIDNTMKNPNRTIVLVVNKGIVPPKNWWVNEPGEVIKVG